MDGRSRRSIRTLTWLTLLAVGFGLGTAGCPTTKATPLAAKRAPPGTAEECRSCNGVWGRNGLAEADSCNCRTHDGGKRCLDGDDCEGMCVLADDPEREVVEAGPPARGYFVGRCSEVMTRYGCVRVLEHGVRAKGPQRIDSPPAVLCID